MSRRRRLFAMLLLAAVAFSWTPRSLRGQEDARASSTDALSLPRAIAVARENNPTFLASRNDAGAADWAVRSAYASLLPSLDAGGSLAWQGPGEQRFGGLTTDQLGFGNQPSYYFSSYNLGLSYTLNGQILTAPGRARAERDATEARIRTAGASLVRSVTRAYLDVRRREEELLLSGRQLQRARANLELARGRVAVGSATRLDASQAQVEVGRARVDSLRARNAVHTAYLALFQQMGLAPPSGEPPRLTTGFDLVEPDWTEGQIYEEALEHNPDLASLRATSRATDSRVTAARSAYLPTLSLQAGLSGFTREASDASFFVEQARTQAQQQVASCQALNEIFSRLANPLPQQDCSGYSLTDEQVRAIESSNNTFPFSFTRQPAQASLSISIPLFQGLGRQRDLESARADQQDARLQLREQELALRADVGSGLAAVRTAYQSARIEEENQGVADEQLRLAHEQYRVGQVSFVDVIQAETVKAQADQDRLAALFQYHDALADLEALVGRSLREEANGP